MYSDHAEKKETTTKIYKRMNNDIVLAGVGGQGIITIAAVIGEAAMRNGLFIKQSEVHGMSQRGGAVQSHLRISDEPLFSDLIPHGKANLIMAVEPMEALRYLPWLSEEGWLVTNSNPVINIPDYPNTDEIIKEIEKISNNLIIDADRIAANAGFPKSGNMVILGAASPFIDISFETLLEAVENLFQEKGEIIIKANVRALVSGRDITIAKMK
jgi:indolepyruvate ferredoxin oxidoreductase, beta subunit